MNKIKSFFTKCFYIVVALCALAIIGPVFLIVLLITTVLTAIGWLINKAIKRFPRACEYIKLFLEILYSPAYFVGMILHVMARLLLACSYIILLDYKMAKDILKSLIS